MKAKTKHPHLKLKIILSFFLILLFGLVGLFTYINSPKVQSSVYASINKVSSLKIKSAKLHFNLVKRRLIIKDLELFSPKKNQRFIASKISFKFKLWPLLRANLRIKDFQVDNLKVVLGEYARENNRQPPKISLTNLLLVRNISIKNGVFNRVTVKSPQKEVSAEKIKVKYTPSLFGDINLTLDILSPRYSPENKSQLSAESILLEGSTDVNNWIDIFPYVDDLSGRVEGKNIDLGKVNIEQFETKVKYSGKNIKLKKMEAVIDGHNVNIDGFINGNNKKYSINIDVPTPINLPSLGKETSFIDTSGPVKGKISVKGKGLDYKSTEAIAELHLNHKLTAAKPLPAELTAKLKISGGKISVTQSDLKIGETPVSVSGSFNYVNPNLNLTFSGNNVPVETVLNRFRKEHYHPASGIAKVKGTFSGWKPNLKFHLEADVSPGGYYDIKVEKASIILDLTYHQLDLIGKIYQDGNVTGNVELEMKMGGKLADGTRQKSFTLNAKVTNAELDGMMKEYGLSGTGNGTLTISGAPKSYTGSSHTTITDGEFKGIGFTKVENDIKFQTKKLTFNNIRLTLSGANPATFSNPLFMDVTDYGIHFYGSPRAGLKIDAKYMSDSKSWRISDVSYSSLKRPEWVSKLAGTVNKDGGLNLKIDGTFDSSMLVNLREYFRETSGPIELQNINVGGTTKNPSFSGAITFNDNTAQLRGWGYFIDEIDGTIKLSGHTINIPELSGQIEYGDFKLSGSLQHQNLEISRADIKFEGASIRYATKDRAFRMEFDTKLKFLGTPNSSLLTGEAYILDGRYTKNFSIFEKMKTKPAYEEEKTVTEREWKNVRLDLEVKSTGDLKIDNNIGEIWLNTDLNVKGTRAKPHFIGNIETLDGEIHYAGINFEVTRGFVEFRDPYTNPYIEINADKEVGDYNVVLIVRGRINKLRLELESTPPLDQKDILALLTFGVTEDEIENARFGYQLGTGLAAEQVGALLQGPIRKYTAIDRFKIEASPRDTNITRLRFGKDISDRLRINFITDVSTATTVQTFETEYSLTDFLLLKGYGTTDAEYRFNLTFRFRER